MNKTSIAALEAWTEILGSLPHIVRTASTAALMLDAPRRNSSFGTFAGRLRKLVKSLGKVGAVSHSHKVF